MGKSEKPSKEVITIQEVSELLGPPRRTIYQAMHKRADFPRPFKVGKRYFFVRAEIVAYREKLQVEFAEKRQKREHGETTNWHRRQRIAREVARQLRSRSRAPKTPKK